MRLPTYRQRLLVFSLLLATLPVILLGFFSYVKASNMIQQKVNQGNIQILVEKQMRLENILKVMDNKAIQFICSSIVRDSMNTFFTPDDFQALNKLSKSLFSLQSSNLNIQDMYLINLGKGWTLSSTGLYQQGLAFNDQKLKKYIDYPETSFWVSEENNDPSSKDADMQKVNRIGLVKKIPVNSISPTGLITIEFPYTELEKLLYNDGETGELMVLDKDYNILVHKGDSVLNTRTLPAAIIDKIKNSTTNKGYLDIKLNNNAVITFSKSTYNSWIYINIASMKQVTKDSKAIGLFTFYICMIILVLSSVVSYKGSYKIYNPVQKLCDAIKKDTKSEDYKKGKDEFLFIREHIHSLMNTQSQLTNTIEGHLGQLEELFFLKLLNGKLKPADLSDQLKLFHYPTTLKWFYILAIKIDTLKGTNYRDQDRDLMMFAINNIVEELVPKQNYINSLLIDDFQITLIGSTYDTYADMKNNTFNLAQKIQKTVHDSLQFKISIGLSKPFSEFQEMHSAYKEAVEAVKHGTSLDQEIIIFREDMKLSHTPKFDFPKYIEYELIDAIKAADNEKAKKLLGQFLMEVFKDNVTSNQYQIHISRLLIDLIEMLQELGEPFDTLFPEEKQLFDQMFELKTIQAIETWFQCSFIEPVIQILKDCRKLQYRKISSEIIDMIHEQFDTDLSLENCAAVMNYHPSYISRVFSSETGITFSEYLSRYRLKIAKEWLAGTNMKIQEIAEKLRYNNSQNFIRHFRKSEGLTPGQYRSQCEKLDLTPDKT